MKKILALLFTLTFTWASCSDEEERETEKKGYTIEDIVGTWELQSIEAKEVETDNKEATQAIKDMIAKTRLVRTYVFESDGRFTDSYNGNKIPGTYSLEGATLTLTYDSYIESYDIAQLSDDILSHDLDDTEGFQTWGEGVVVSKVILALTYKRK